VIDQRNFGEPTGMVADAQGNLYISQQWPGGKFGSASGGLVYKLTSAGQLTLLAGGGADSNKQDGTGAAAIFKLPRMRGIDADGNLYLTDVSDNNTARARKVTPQGVVTTIEALPAGLGAAPDGYAYTADPQQRVVYRTGADGVRSVAANLPAPDASMQAQLPGGLFLTPTLVPTGPSSFALLHAGAVLKLVLPH
jgi:sugar lactone lactonase YvrE